MRRDRTRLEADFEDIQKRAPIVSRTLIPSKKKKNCQCSWVGNEETTYLGTKETLFVTAEQPVLIVHQDVIVKITALLLVLVDVPVR